MIARGFPLVAIAALAVAGCSKGVHYPATPAEVHKKLVKHELPLVMFGSNASGTRLVAASNSSVVWAVTDHMDNELIRLAANIEPEADGSRVTTEVLPPAGVNHDKMAKGLKEKQAITDVYRAVANEQVASSMNDRAFDYDAISPAIMKAAFEIVPELRREALEEASSAQRLQRRAAASYEDSSARYRERTGQPDPTYGKPMDDQHGSYDEDY